MITSSNVAVVALAFVLTFQESYGFHTPTVASPTRWLQPTAKSTSSPHPTTHQQPAWGSIPTSRPNVLSSRRFAPPLRMANDDGGEAKGFSSPERKVSRKSAKKAKARGGAPAFPAGKAAAQEPSKAVTAEVVKEAQPGESADAAAARQAIEKMENEERERVAERQSRVDNVMAAKAASEEDPDAGSIPDVVANRMLKRMVPFFLLPAIGGIGVFVAVYVLSHNYDYTVPAYIVAYATQAPFFIALLGITYAILSSSWDEDREGSMMGADEAKRNFSNIMEGLRRSSDRMDVEDMLADQEQQTLNRRERRMRKDGDK